MYSVISFVFVIRSLSPFIIARNTRSGVAGISRSRTPMARDIALMIAGVAGSMAASPRPLTPCGPSRPGTSTRITSVCGMDLAVGR